MKALSVVFAGTPEFGLPCLEALQRSVHTVTAVYTQPDRLAGRGRKLQASAVKQWALTQQIPVYQPVNFKEQSTRDELAALKPDVMVVIAYGLILPAAVLTIPRLGCINVHASLLPRWRGASPIQQAVLHGDTSSGVTIMQMDVGMDTGAMLAQEECLLSPTETAGSLHDKLAQSAVEPLLATLDALACGKVNPTPQDEALVTYAGKIHKEDACINWQHSATVIDQLIRAYSPWPIAYTHADADILRIHQAKSVEMVSTKAPGTVLSLDKQGIMVATGQNCLLIQQIQFPGGKIISVAEWINAGKTQIYPGLVLQ